MPTLTLVKKLKLQINSCSGNGKGVWVVSPRPDYLFSRAKDFSVRSINL